MPTTRRLRCDTAKHLTLVVGMMLVVCPAAASSSEPARAQSPTLVDCQERFAARPEDHEAVMCFYECAQAPHARDTVRRALISLGERHPANGWLALVLGHVEYLSDREAAEAAYLRAADIFRERQNAEGEVLAGINLRSIMLRQKRTEEALSWTHRVGEVANASGRPDLRARALIVEASQLHEVEYDLGRAFRVLKRAEPLTFPDGTPGLKKQYLTMLHIISERLGRLEEATEATLRLVELARSSRDLISEARARHTLANLMTRRHLRDRAPETRSQALRMAREALVASRNAGVRQLEAKALRLIADLLGESPEEQREAEELLRLCMRIAEELASDERKISCLWTRAERRAGVDPVGAIQDSEESIQLALRVADPLVLALALRGRGQVAYLTQPLPVALEHVERALDAVESLRASQSDALIQAELFASWASDYHRLAGWTLEAGGATGKAALLDPREAMSRAFAVSERMRARSLLDALAASHALATTAETPERKAQRAEVRGRLTTVQRRLLETTHTAAQREAALRELQELERVERDLRTAPRQGTREFASLASIEQGLGEDEALLAFLVGDDTDTRGDFAGGAWVLAVTRTGTRAHRIPERARLTPAVALFSGLLERRDGSEAGAAAALYAQLLGPALAELPTGVRRLLVVPDGPLHDLPFAALRQDAEGPPLVARYELSLMPSASLWRHWRQASAPPPGGEALVLADPDRSVRVSDARTVAKERMGVFTEAARVGALPEARREGHAVMEALRGTAVTPHLRTGTEASERALKSADLARVRVLHVAGHAVVDAEAPERSALVLAPGSEQEDGILQPREIAELHLQGALVVLSACRSASGAVLPGEGVLSLSRAFFEAGSRAVVASLWPLRDAEAADLVEHFYQYLAQGLSSSAALRRAQLEAIEDGLPPAAWAGLVVLGDASLAVTAPREDSLSSGSLMVGTGTLALVLFAGILVWRARRSAYPKSAS
ncbi:CHAT domain-containing protein [Myxococcus sp. AM010]|uniref:CHAT domain-containing protein n=1 Tax=Myxococcus sp. AM010 TaxID=2745138 RepID=UPI0015953893|nr:CHAT domain-containing protein [Myxococcus sp. AM010]NVJ14020.1 CHAT domain-containing protein [Myxococcus sp. AM010]